MTGGTNGDIVVAEAIDVQIVFSPDVLEELGDFVNLYGHVVVDVNNHCECFDSLEVDPL